MGGEHDPFAGLFHAVPAASAPPPSRRDDFRDRPHVQSREGHSLGRLLASLPTAAAQPPAAPEPAPAPAPAGVADDDADMVVIVDDADDADPVAGRVTPVRPGDYRSLFTRLRRGDRR
jgi:hypothetical protein